METETQKMKMILDVLISNFASRRIIEKYKFEGKKKIQIIKLLAEYQTLVTAWGARLVYEAALREKAEKNYIILTSDNKVLKTEKLNVLNLIIGVFGGIYAGQVGEPTIIEDAKKQKLSIGDIVLCSNNKTFECCKGVVINIYNSLYSFDSIILMVDNNVICDANSEEWTINKSSQLTIADLKNETIKVVEINENRKQEN